LKMQPPTHVMGIMTDSEISLFLLMRWKKLRLQAAS
jgi:hypothetical protein